MKESCVRIILASGSGIRREILANAGVKFSVRVGRVNEDAIKEKHLSESPCLKSLAQSLAIAKANEMPPQENECVIGADQLLDFNGQLFDKPKTMAEARERLVSMRGKTHCLIGAIAVVQKDQEPWTHLTMSHMHMRNFSDSFLDSYIEGEGEKILSSVGGYMFEKGGAQLFNDAGGDFFSILGLSLFPLLDHLRSIGAIEK